MAKNSKLICIDLDNSPHVPFFQPIMHVLRKRGYSLLVTARDVFQVAELTRLRGLISARPGRWGIR